MKQTKKLPEWTRDGVVKVLGSPYLSGLLLSLRDSTIALNAATSRRKRIENKPGRADRKRYDEIAELRVQEVHCLSEIDSLQKEIRCIGVVCGDPVQCVAKFRLCVQNLLGWFVYSPFGNQLYWRFDRDARDVARDIRELPHG